MSFLVNRRGAAVGPEKSSSELNMTAVGSILRESDHTAWVDAHGLLAQAEQAAQRKLAQAEQAVQRRLAQGEQEAQRILEHATQQAADTVANAQMAVMLQFAEKKANYVKGVEQDIVELVMSSVRKIITDFNDQAGVLTVVRGGLALLRQQKQVVLYVNAADIDTVRQSLQDLLTEFPGIEYIDVTADERFEPGSCRLETEVGTVQTSLKEQWAILEKELRRALGHAPVVPGVPDTSDVLDRLDMSDTPDTSSLSRTSSTSSVSNDSGFSTSPSEVVPAYV
jgi:type III secretion protein L